MTRQSLLIKPAMVLLVLSLAWPRLERFSPGRLPGDILVEREHFTVYAPVTSALLDWLWRR